MSLNNTSFIHSAQNNPNSYIHSFTHLHAFPFTHYSIIYSVSYSLRLTICLIQTPRLVHSFTQHVFSKIHFTSYTLFHSFTHLFTHFRLIYSVTHPFTYMHLTSHSPKPTHNLPHKYAPDRTIRSSIHPLSHSTSNTVNNSLFHSLLCNSPFTHMFTHTEFSLTSQAVMPI